jgi:branched-chain amino acid transport system substrate-binding protein
MTLTPRAAASRQPTRRTLVATAISALALLPLLVPGTAGAAEDIVVGATVPITGNFAASGIQYYNALKLAQDDINAAGGINGRNLRIVFEDTAANNSTAVNAFVKLIKQYNPPVVFLSSLSTQTLAMEPEVLKAKVPAITAGGAVAIQERKNPWLFRARPADNLGAGAMVYGIVELLKKSKPGILYAQDDYGTGAANAVEAMLAKSGVAVVAKEAFNPRDNDFSAQLLSLKNKGVDVIVSFNYNRDGALILKQRKSLGLNIAVVAGTGMVAPSTLELVDADDLTGVYSTADTIVGEAVSPASAEFVKRYTAAFKIRPDSFGTSYYDAAMIVAEGMRKVGPDPEKLRGYLAGVADFKGMARNYSTDAGTNNMAHSVVLVTFKPGTKDFVAVATYPKP